MPPGERSVPVARLTFPACAFDQAVTVEHGMDGTFGGDPDVAGQPADEKIADFAGAPMRFVALGVDDEALDPLRELVGIAHRSTRSIGEGFEAMLLVAVENL